MVVTPRFRPFRLVSALEVETELFGELLDVRVELYREAANARSFRVRLFRTAVVQSLISVDEDEEEAEVAEWQTLEEFTILLDPQDAAFEAGSVEEAEQRVLEALRRKVLETAWSKTN